MCIGRCAEDHCLLSYRLSLSRQLPGQHSAYRFCHVRAMMQLDAVKCGWRGHRIVRRRAGDLPRQTDRVGLIGQHHHEQHHGSASSHGPPRRGQQPFQATHGVRRPRRRPEATIVARLATGRQSRRVGGQGRRWRRAAPQMQQAGRCGSGLARIGADANGQASWRAGGDGQIGRQDRTAGRNGRTGQPRRADRQDSWNRWSRQLDGTDRHVR